MSDSSSDSGADGDAGSGLGPAPDSAGASERPNVLFVMTDQHRADALGADPACPRDRNGRPLVHSPNLDSLIEAGAYFERAYSPAPTCIPARRCLWTGQTPATNGATTWVTDDWDFESPLPRLLRDGGYQTHLAGKTHSLPQYNRIGFESLDLHGALGGNEDDYDRWLAAETGDAYDELTHGLDRNSWDPRPSHLPEHQHPTTWTADRALDFLERRDPTRPFFLTVSFVRPHQPFDPPQAEWDLYADRLDDLPDPVVGDWVEDWYGDLLPDHPRPDAWLADLSPDVVARARAGYYGSITHVDRQLNRVFNRLRSEGLWEDTLVIFTSDHGEMLGDHYHWRKSYPWEGSARIPLAVRYPDAWDAERGLSVERPVGLEDVAPTVLEACGIECPSAVEGRSLLDLCRDPTADWRRFYHGEHGPTYDDIDACQFLVGERKKYVWNPVTGADLLFDLETDPLEERDRSAERPDRLARWRERLVETLADRPEGFVADGDLSPVSPEAWR
jgi:arylsulfatase A-like enzyme